MIEWDLTTPGIELHPSRVLDVVNVTLIFGRENFSLNNCWPAPQHSALSPDLVLNPGDKARVILHLADHSDHTTADYTDPARDHRQIIYSLGKSCYLLVL